MSADPPRPAAATSEGRNRPAGVMGATWWVVARAWRGWQADNADRLSAAVAMSGVLSLASLLVLAIKAAAVALGEPAATRMLHQQVRGFVGPNQADAVGNMVAGATRPGAGTLATAVSLGVLLFTASGVFGEVRGGLNAVWGIDPKAVGGWRAFARDRLLSLGMVVAAGALLLASQGVTTALSAYGPRGLGWGPVAADFVLSTAVMTVLFGLAFRFLPDARVGWRSVAAGAVATAVLLKAGQYLLALYFTHVATGSLYGAAGSFVVVMLWVYYSSWVLFYGAELIKAYAELTGRPIRPPAGPSAGAVG